MQLTIMIFLMVGTALIKAIELPAGGGFLTDRPDGYQKIAKRVFIMPTGFEPHWLSQQGCLKQQRLLPLVTLTPQSDALALGQLLVSLNVRAIEVTFRSAAAPQGIAALRAAAPELLIAAGTVLSQVQIDLAREAGADLIITPGLNPTTVRYCVEQGLPVIPGVNSPTQIEQAMELGLNTLKFFPAEASGGVAFLRAMAGPYPDIQFVPTGGLNPHNMADYLALPNVLACGGSWLMPTEAADQVAWQTVSEHILAARQQWAAFAL